MRGFTSDIFADPDEGLNDPELGRADYWTCIKCKNRQNNPMYRYCEKCYRVSEFNLYCLNGRKHSVFVHSTEQFEIHSHLKSVNREMNIAATKHFTFVSATLNIELGIFL